MADDDNVFTLKLSTPIPAHGETLSELKLRPPLVSELRRAGAPFVGGLGSSAPDFGNCALLISLMCGIPPSSVDRMEYNDFASACAILVGFSMGATAKSLSEIRASLLTSVSTSRGSGNLTPTE
jgi:hypothetical protein